MAENDLALFSAHSADGSCDLSFADSGVLSKGVITHYAYSLEEIGQILSVLPEPAATVFAVAAFTERLLVPWEADAIGREPALCLGHLFCPRKSLFEDLRLYLSALSATWHTGRVQGGL